ncbi:MAG: MFS transporter, partial [Syntrophothermus sp.]
ALQLALGIGLLTMGIVRGPEWGWADPRALAAFAAAAALVAGFLRRSGRHSAPVIELSLLRVRPFAVANLATLVFFSGFGAMLLSGVLLLTRVWGYSAPEAGLALMPAPATAAVFAIPAGRLGGGIGQRPIAVGGAIVFSAGFAYILAAIEPQPDYARAFLPGSLLAGAGFGLVLGTLPAVISSALPQSRFATGTAVLSMARQLGTAIGVAVLVALIDSGSGSEPLAGLRRGWWFSLAAGLAAAAVAFALGPSSAAGLPLPRLPALVDGHAGDPEGDHGVEPPRSEHRVRE